VTNRTDEISEERNRGFEKVSFEQFKKDFLNNPTGISIDENPEEIYNNLIIPFRATAGSAGYDFFAPCDIDLQPGEDILIPTGIKVYMKQDEKLEISPRSGLGTKFYLRLSNTIGKIDSDYFNNQDNEGHIFIKIRNEGFKACYIEKGKAFAQGSFERYLLSDGDTFTGNKRISGMGSTG